MPETVVKLTIILVHDPVAGTTEVINAGEIGSDDPLDSRTRNVGEEQRVVTPSEKANTLNEFLIDLTASAGSTGGL